MKQDRGDKTSCEQVRSHTVVTIECEGKRTRSRELQCAKVEFDLDSWPHPHQQILQIPPPPPPSYSTAATAQVLAPLKEGPAQIFDPLRDLQLPTSATAGRLMVSEG
ncbi:hypothetical protein Q8A67_019333 [Cirrhinus molitorella]|uniref:Uncharacterized protein n=1 Tax=Cirrhinus molitorella TaxID=172907 RepID=A0AA88PFB9_9TELE|nr:hypothetical protein Q8A67_019333 [Cirrhinus molitorella]